MNQIRFHRDWRQVVGKTAERGMSLVEVMVVIAIILTLMGILTFSIFQIFGQSQQDTTKIMMSKVAQRVEIHMLRKGLPSTGEGLSAVFPEGVPKDAWDNDIQYVAPGPNGKKYDLISYGEDGQQGGAGMDEDLRYSDSL